MFLRSKLLLVVASGLLSLSVHGQTLEVAGSAAMYKLAFEKHGEAIKAATGVDVKYSSSSSGKGLLALVDGSIKVAGAADTYPDAVEGLKKMKPGIQIPGNLKFHEFFVDTLVPIVHRENPISTLSKAQLKSLFAGTVTNWKELGGPDLPVKLLVGPAGAATTEAFLKQVLDGAKPSTNAVELRSASAMLSEVARDKGAIGSYSLDVAEKANNLKIVAGLRIARPMSLATLGDPSPEVTKVVGFLKSPAGQKMLTD